jgi:hypothetical protein
MPVVGQFAARKLGSPLAGADLARASALPTFSKLTPRPSFLCSSREGVAVSNRQEPIRRPIMGSRKPHSPSNADVPMFESIQTQATLV